jgi:hypothetical protein
LKFEGFGNFLGHSGFFRNFVQFLKISRILKNLQRFYNPFVVNLTIVRVKYDLTINEVMVTAQIVRTTPFKLFMEL